MPSLNHPIHHRVGLGTGAGHQSVHHPAQQSGIGVAQQGHGPVIVQFRLGLASNELIEDGQRIAHGPASGPHHQPQHPVLGRDALGTTQIRHVVAQYLRGNQPERIVMGAGANRGNDLFGIRGCKNEFNVVRRLLYQL